MTTPPSISALPTVPSRNDPSTFSSRMDAFLAAFPDFRTEIIALANWMNALAILADGGTYEVQTSLTDTTAGRLMKVGAGGLLGSAILIGDASATDNSIAPGLYSYSTSSGSLGGPGGAVLGTILHIRRTSGGGESQLFVWEGGTGGVIGQLYSRARTGGAWSPWEVSALEGHDAAFASVDAGAITMANTLIAGEKITISDDAAAFFDMPKNGGFIMLSGNNEGAFPIYGGLMYADVGSSIALTVIHAGTYLETATGVLSGTTGTDGKVTASVHTDGNFYIENRTGAGLAAAVHFFA